MGSSGITSLINLLITNIDVLAWPVVSLVYPLYASIREIEMKTGDDVQQWLTYWVLYSMISFLEDTFVTLVEWLTFWPYAKLMLSCWLVYCNGAAYVYQHYVRPCVVIIPPPPPPPPEPVQVSKIPRRKRGSSKLAYFTQNGLEKMMHKEKLRKAPR
ncbi:HVA22-like protein a [Salvia splendens]|uniref:HVA22-like protein a n=1 Tax=Salvia splendens TaxID=180675 RepID=UPI001100D45B|nr:HVA22-like protein a [Salvia splendens]